MSDAHLKEAEVTEKESVLIESVLHHYDISVHMVKRVRSAYKVHSDLGVFCVKRLKHGRGKVRNGYLLVKALNKNDFFNTATYRTTIRGNYYVQYGKYTFYVTEWIDGEECDLGNAKEAVRCAELLARFHCSVNSPDLKMLKLKNNLKNWPKIFYENLLDLEKFKQNIEKKLIQTQFDRLYYDYIDTFHSRGLTALTFLNSSNYYKLSKEANKFKSICHDSFYYQNIIKRNDEYYLIDLDSIIIDLQIIDLGKFIRRLMSKKDYRWNFEKAKNIIESYSKIRPISKEELEVILAQLIFPYRFWKLGKRRYKKQKDWSDAKYLKKLNKLIQYSLEEQRFIEDFTSYINNLV